MKTPKVSIIIPTFNRKADLKECLESVLMLEYPDFEVIVVDDCSADDSVGMVKKHFPAVMTVVNAKNSGASVSRNNGIKAALGEYFFFLDSDTKIDPAALSELVRVMQAYPKAGICGPKIYYYDEPEVVWYAGAGISLLTGKTTYRGGERDAGQYAEVIETGHVPTAFLVKREVVEKIGLFDPIYFIICEESDFAERAIQAGFKVMFAPKAKVWHKLSFAGFSEADLRVQKAVGLRNPERGYLVSRNRIIYMRKNSTAPKLVVFFGVFLPLITGWYIAKTASLKRFDIAGAVLKGVLAGITCRVAKARA